MSVLYVLGHLLDSKDPVVNKIDSPTPQGVNDLVRMKNTNSLRPSHPELARSCLIPEAKQGWA